jgi:hypothetical protein
LEICVAKGRKTQSPNRETIGAGTDDLLLKLHSQTAAPQGDPGDNHGAVFERRCVHENYEIIGVINKSRKKMIG